MARIPRSTLSVRLSAFFLLLAGLGCVANWFRDGTIGVVSIVVLTAVGLGFLVAAHRLSRRGV